MIADDPKTTDPNGGIVLLTDQASCGEPTRPPTFISYDPQLDRASFWLKGGAGPGEIKLTTPIGAITLGFDAAGHIVLLEIPGEALHPDLVPFAARDYPAEGNL